MKERDSQFDVWLRIKPFEKLNPDSHSCTSQSRLRSTQSERSPFQLQRSRSKSPATFNTTYLSKLKAEKTDLSKQDYRGFHAKEDTIHIDSTCCTQASPAKSPGAKRPQTVRFPNIIHEHVKIANPAQSLSTKLWAIAPVGGPREGWDECFPPSVGSADAEHGIYWVCDHITAVTFLSPRSKGTHTANDPAEFSNK